MEVYSKQNIKEYKYLSFVLIIDDVVNSVDRIYSLIFSTHTEVVCTVIHTYKYKAALSAKRLQEIYTSQIVTRTLAVILRFIVAIPIIYNIEDNYCNIRCAYCVA